MTIVSAINDFRDLLDFFPEHFFVPKKSTIAAYKRYEKKAKRDFERENSIKMNRNQRLPQTALLCLSNCDSIKDAIEKLGDHGRFESGYMNRFVTIWYYNEHINVPNAP